MQQQFVQFSQNLLGLIWWSSHWLLIFITFITTQTKTRSSWHCIEAVTYLETQSITTCLQNLSHIEHIEDQSRAGAVGSSARVPSHSCLSICPTWWGRSWSCEPCTCPSYFWFWEDELLCKELVMWTLHLPLLLPDLPRQVRADFEIMGWYWRSWWCEPCISQRYEYCSVVVVVINVSEFISFFQL